VIVKLPYVIILKAILKGYVIILNAAVTKWAS